MPFESLSLNDPEVTDLAMTLIDDMRSKTDAMHRANEIDNGLDARWSEFRNVFPDYKLITNTGERKRAFLVDEPNVMFPVNDNPDASDDVPWWENKNFSTVNRYRKELELAAMVHGVDPNLLKAIMYMETTRGFYDHCINSAYTPYPYRVWLAKHGKTRTYPGLKTIQPMNINHHYWGDAFGTREDLERPLHNILVAAEFLRRLSRFAGNPNDIERIATLYNHLGARQISDYGKRVATIYRQRLWEHPELADNPNGKRLRDFMNQLVFLSCRE